MVYHRFLRCRNEFRTRRGSGILQAVLAAALVPALGIAVVPSVLGADVTWDGSTDAVWDQPDATSWSGDSYNSGDTAQFFGAGAGLVTIVAGGVTPGAVVVNSSADYTFAGGPIAGTATLTKSGTGILYLQNANTYTGRTTVNGGGILDVGLISNNAISGNSGLLLGTTTADDSGVLQGHGAFTRSLSLNSTPGTNQVSGQRGGFAARGGDLTVNFGGSGAGISLNTGGYVFGADFIFGSATADGKVVLINPVNINSGDPNSTRNFTVHAGVGGAEATSAELQGVISNANATTPNGIRKQGDGTLILSAANTYSGPTQIIAGTVQIGNGGVTGSLTSTTANGANGTVSISSGATLAFNRSDNLLFENTVTGAGGVNQIGSGTTTLTAVNTYSGLTNVMNFGVLDVGTIGSGALSGNSGLLLGSAVSGSGNYGILQGNGTFTRSLGSNATPNSSQVASASGGFAARGGQLTLNFGGAGAGFGLNQSGFKFGYNFVFGSATADSKVVLINPFNINNNNVNATRRITVIAGIGGADATSAELQGTLSNANATTPNGIRKLGDGTLILSANNTYSGPTLIEAGTVQIGNGGVTGSLTSTTANAADGSVTISSGATLAFNRSDSLTLDNLVKGAGEVRQIGSGATILTNANSYTGDTTVSNGTLLVNGNQSAATGAVTVAAGATLGGSGTVGGATTVFDGGSLTGGMDAAAGTIGVLSFANGLDTESGSTWLVDLVETTSGQSDLIAVTGNLSLGGANIVLRRSGDFTVGNTYTIATYTGNLSGTFDGLAQGEVIDGYRIDYGALSNGAITLTAIPEPTTFGLLAALAGACFLLRRRRGVPAA